MNKDKKLLHKSFPDIIKEEVFELLERLTIHSKHSIQGTFPVFLKNEILDIPTRIYWEEQKIIKLNKLEQEQCVILSCILTRHHNGYVREEYLRNIIDSDSYWTTPYIVQLLGEYVIEIINIIDLEFEKINKNNLKQFVLDNPVFWNKTKSRVVSYWDCYYRKRRINQLTGFIKSDYPGFLIIERIEGLLHE